MRKTIIAANWKMHLNTHQASLFLHKLDQKVAAHRDVITVLCPNMLALQSLSLQINHRKFKLGAQNCFWRDEGPFTGEVSATMLHGVVQYVIVGHSERRHGFGETDADVRQKVQAVIRNRMVPIICVGETAGERANGETKDVLHGQVTAALANVTSDEIDQIVIAYEPVWAIGSGQSASPNDALDAISFIRGQIKALYGAAAAEAIHILYGGSVDNHNATGYLGSKGIDGLLVGGASLKANVFSSIVEQAHAKHDKKSVK
ncbi:triose-phosphate isomerase [Candidatus Saccharibacteria bacterium]|nr:MAG: triose-phosphate isomerase [Candidatus Saccharibacteria bacterium]